MRQFLLGLIVAALAWWGYGKWSSSEVQANAVGPRVEAPPRGGAAAGDANIGSLLGAGDPPGARAPATDEPPAARDDAAQPLPRDVAELLEKVGRGDRAAIGTAWLAVATQRLGADHQRVVQALQPASDAFEDQLAMLGGHNAFLRSPEGRAAARRATAAAMALPDAAALDAGSQLIYLMVCGEIEKQHADRREVVDEAFAQHRVRVERWLCNPTNVAGARSYTVKSGDRLERIARRFRREDGLKLDWGTIAALNRIQNPNSIRIGQVLKIPVQPVTGLLEKDSYALMVFVGKQLLRLYWVGHGKNDHTPVTEFEVLSKHEKPDWTAPDGNVYPYAHPENVLGEYFIKFGHRQYTGFGAHSTPDLATIHTMSSAGCIRMKPGDIDELFRLLPIGAKVVVRDTAAR